MKITFKKKALRFLKKQNKQVQDRLITAIYNLPKGDVKFLIGASPYKRLRVGDYRVIFDDQGYNIIDIIDIGNRGDIY